ncbi:hypothetical protein C8Q75DRAFT_809640 [Abortiporus biennis]|nr:hypothetical protein C8Q75DRAFT_809640 [Abortiporus biennis]
MHVSCIQAGTLLARIARPEVQNCIDGLEQYSYAYEECAEQAAEIKRIYAQACAGEIELNHMASVAPPPGTGIYEQTLTSMEVAGNAVMNGVMNHPSMYTTQYQV